MNHTVLPPSEWSIAKALAVACFLSAGGIMATELVAAKLPGGGHHIPVGYNAPTGS